MNHGVVLPKKPLGRGAGSVVITFNVETACNFRVMIAGRMVLPSVPVAVLNIGEREGSSKDLRPIHAADAAKRALERNPAASYLEAMRASCSRRAARKPFGNLSVLRSVRSRNPRVALAESNLGE